MSEEKYIIESLLFVSEGPLPVEQIKEVLGHLESNKIRELILELKKEYEENKRGIHIVEVANGFQMVTNPQFSSYLKKFYRQRHKERLSLPALETLAIIAYKQPVTRLDIESIRGVNVDGIIKHLLEKGLIRITGRKQVIGRPFVYGTTKQFLEHFGLSSLDELPKMEEFTSLLHTKEEKEESQEQNLQTQQQEIAEDKPAANQSLSEGKEEEKNELRTIT
jgi:segregation and condensation protein B